MSKTKAAQAVALEHRKYDWEVAWYKFERLKFRLTVNAFYAPDSAVLLADGCTGTYELEGHRHYDARVKIWIAVDMYPLRFIAIQAKTMKEGGWWRAEIL